MWTREKIQKLLDTNKTMIERSLLVLYSRQTKTERVVQETTEHNKMGFNGVDAKFLSSLAEQIKQNKYNRPEGQRLSNKQLLHARRQLRKYAKQLADYANAQNEIKAQKALGTSEKISSKLFQKGGSFGEQY